MDQLKAQLAVAIKYGFWIGSAFVLLTSLGVWYWTTSKLASESAAQTSKIKSAISTVRAIESELFKHPNELSHEQMNALIAERQDQVLQSWKTLYDRQRNILTWPENLTANFVDEFVDLIPIEIYVPFPTPETEEKEETLLRIYQRYIKGVLPDIAKIARTEWTAEFESAGGAAGYGVDMSDPYANGPMPGMAVDITGAKDGPLVKWSQASQSSILSDLFPWRGSMPSTLEVYYSQENIWILKQLLQIVDDVNGEARQPYQAKIHEIVGLGIGKSVKFTSGTISKPGDTMAAGMGGMGGMDDMGMMEDEYGDMGGGMDDYGSMDSGMSGFAETMDPADNRYVNEQLESIAGASLRDALTSNSPSDVALAVAKRVPVMMSLKMDQRAVSELLAACGSAPLMVEVKQVRILPTGNTPGGAGGGYGDDGGGYGSDMDGGYGSDMGDGGYGAAPVAVPAEPAKEFPLDMNVEVYGLIYIYNPPDPAKLGLELVTKETVGELVDDPSATAATEANGELPVPQIPTPAATDPADPAGQPPADGAVPAPTTPTPPAQTPAGAAPVATDPSAAAATP